MTSRPSPLSLNSTQNNGPRRLVHFTHYLFHFLLMLLTLCIPMAFLVFIAFSLSPPCRLALSLSILLRSFSVYQRLLPCITTITFFLLSSSSFSFHSQFPLVRVESILRLLCKWRVGWSFSWISSAVSYLPSFAIRPQEEEPPLHSTLRVIHLHHLSMSIPLAHCRSMLLTVD